MLLRYLKSYICNSAAELRIEVGFQSMTFCNNSIPDYFFYDIISETILIKKEKCYEADKTRKLDVAKTVY